MVKVTPVPLEQLRNNLAEFVRRAEAGERIVGTFHGQATVAMIGVSEFEKLVGKVDLPKRPKRGRE